MSEAARALLSTPGDAGHPSSLLLKPTTSLLPSAPLRTLEASTLAHLPAFQVTYCPLYA
jgi:hypothetical protein